MEIEAVNGDSNKEEERGRRLYKGRGGRKRCVKEDGFNDTFPSSVISRERIRRKGNEDREIKGKRERDEKKKRKKNGKISTMIEIDCGEGNFFFSYLIFISFLFEVGKSFHPLSLSLCLSFSFSLTSFFLGIVEDESKTRHECVRKR